MGESSETLSLDRRNPCAAGILHAARANLCFAYGASGACKLLDLGHKPTLEECFQCRFRKSERCEKRGADEDKEFLALIHEAREKGWVRGEYPPSPESGSFLKDKAPKPPCTGEQVMVSDKPRNVSPLTYVGKTKSECKGCVYLSKRGGYCDYLHMTGSMRPTASSKECRKMGVFRRGTRGRAPSAVGTGGSVTPSFYLDEDELRRAYET